MFRELSRRETGHMYLKLPPVEHNVQEVAWGSQASVQIMTVLFIGLWI